jgi:hypothetical protein
MGGPRSEKGRVAKDIAKQPADRPHKVKVAKALERERGPKPKRR